jgi:hypothetical protein
LPSEFEPPCRGCLMTIVCDKESCTVAETNICLLNNPLDTCPHRKKTADGAGPPSIEPPLGQPEQNPRLPHSRTMTPTQARDLMAARYCTLVGILGDPDAGKTAALVSLYLLVSRAKLEGFDFSDSRTLMAFNEISQGALDWNEGQLPDELTQHTELADDRTAGFLHLRLRRNADGEMLDFLLPDLPGEWSKSFRGQRSEGPAPIPQEIGRHLVDDGREATPRSLAAPLGRSSDEPFDRAPEDDHRRSPADGRGPDASRRRRCTGARLRVGDRGSAAARS